ncbi:MAG: isoprenyl transferase [Bdellovibrionales bacterium]
MEAKLDISPLHVAIIMDGNGRWARQKNQPRTLGHKAGIDALRRTLEAARNLPIRYLTFYSFSAENWSRPESEVNELMGLLRFYLKHEIKTLVKNKVRFRVIGDRARLDDDIRAMIQEAEEATKAHTALDLTLALSYGGRQEILEAVRALARKVEVGELCADGINEAIFEEHLYTKSIPDPDLVIRTSGEKRISNFLLWQSAYAEYVFEDVLWPDFGDEHLRAALDAYAARERRFGR